MFIVAAKSYKLLRFFREWKHVLIFPSVIDSSVCIYATHKSKLGLSQEPLSEKVHIGKLLAVNVLILYSAKLTYVTCIWHQII